MNQSFKMVKAALNDAVGKQVDITNETDLIKEEVLDSLDSAVFLLNIEKAFGIKLIDEMVEEQNLFKIADLLEFLNDNSPNAKL